MSQSRSFFGGQTQKLQFTFPGLVDEFLIQYNPFCGCPCGLLALNILKRINSDIYCNYSCTCYQHSDKSSTYSLKILNTNIWCGCNNSQQSIAERKSLFQHLNQECSTDRLALWSHPASWQNYLLQMEPNHIAFSSVNSYMTIELTSLESDLHIKHFSACFKHKLSELSLDSSSVQVFVGLLRNYFKITFYLSTSKDSEVLRNIETGSPTCKKYKENKSPLSQRQLKTLATCYANKIQP